MVEKKSSQNQRQFFRRNSNCISEKQVVPNKKALQIHTFSNLFNMFTTFLSIQT